MRSTNKRNIKLSVLLYILAVTGVLVVVNACNKNRHDCNRMDKATNTDQAISAATPLQQGVGQSKVVSVLALTPATDGASTWVIFRELAEQFTVTDAGVLNSLKAAMNENKPVRATFDPWSGIVSDIKAVNESELIAFKSRIIVKSPGTNRNVDLSAANFDEINNQPELGIINTTSPSTGLTDVIPDFATAQLMFDYLANQCCNVPGPYGVDHCITFQYCEDGCYARAHKMCYVINNRYHYQTHKIFSFAYPGAYTLSVKAQKWGGCCIRWWYHVAPLVNIKTPTGTKAYVFDPAMFDQPVLLSTWLHWQQNPSCAGTHIPKVTSYNIQPTASYAPNDTATFITDPLFSDTNTTLINYHSLISCP